MISEALNIRELLGTDSSLSLTDHSETAMLSPALTLPLLGLALLVSRTLLYIVRRSFLVVGHP